MDKPERKPGRTTTGFVIALTLAILFAVFFFFYGLVRQIEADHNFSIAAENEREAVRLKNLAQDLTKELLECRKQADFLRVEADRFRELAERKK